MQILLPIVTILIIAMISIFNGKKTPAPEKKTATNPIPSVSQTVSPTGKKSENNKTASPSPTDSPPQKNSDKFMYPNASISSRSEETITMTSTDNPNAITDWYKNTIRLEGMSATSFV